MQLPEQTQSVPVVIRRANRLDLEAIGDLWVELMSFHAALDPRFRVPPQGRANYVRHIQNTLRNDAFRVFVAVVDGRVIGYIMGYIAQNLPIFPEPQYGFIADLCVSESARRHGAGALLVHTLRNWFRERGLTSVQLNVAHHNHVSQAFWRKMGSQDYLDHMWMGLE